MHVERGPDHQRHIYAIFLVPTISAHKNFKRCTDIHKLQEAVGMYNFARAAATIVAPKLCYPKYASHFCSYACTATALLLTQKYFRSRIDPHLYVVMYCKTNVHRQKSLHIGTGPRAQKYSYTWIGPEQVLPRNQQITKPRTIMCYFLARAEAPCQARVPLQIFTCYHVGRWDSQLAYPPLWAVAPRLAHITRVTGTRVRGYAQ